MGASTDVLGDAQDRAFDLFNDSDNIQDLLEVLADPFQDLNNVINFILDSSDIDDAEGEQLDKKGAKIGVRRPRLQETRIFTLCRTGEIQDPDKGFSDDENPGGYFATREGLGDQDDPTAMMSDADYRYLIRQKAASYRTKMTRTNLYNYLIAFGGRCKIDDDTEHEVWIDPSRRADFIHWFQNYIEKRGFSPAGINVQFKGTDRHADSI